MAKPELPPLTALRAFQAAGDAMSFQEAARRLSVTPSAISHQIRLIEEWIEAPLFARSPRRIEFTPTGKRFHKEITAAFERIRVAAHRAKGEITHTKLRISALPLITNVWLIPRLGNFEERHPGISLEIETSNRIVDFNRDNVDVGIRNVRSPTPGLFAQKLLDIRLVPLCARKLVTGPNALRHPKDLANHTLIHVTARPSAWPRWLKEVGVGDLKPKRDISFDTVPAALEAAARGHGVTLGMSPLVWEAPAIANLVVPFAPRVEADSSYYVVHRKADRARPEIRAFVDWLMKEMAAFARAHRSIPQSARLDG